MTVSEIKAELKSLGFPTDGKKDELLERLKRAKEVSLSVAGAPRSIGEHTVVTLTDGREAKVSTMEQKGLAPFRSDFEQFETKAQTVEAASGKLHVVFDNQQKATVEIFWHSLPENDRIALHPNGDIPKPEELELSKKGELELALSWTDKTYTISRSKGQLKVH